MGHQLTQTATMQKHSQRCINVPVHNVEHNIVVRPPEVGSKEATAYEGSRPESSLPVAVLLTCAQRGVEPRGLYMTPTGTM